MLRAVMLVAGLGLVGSAVALELSGALEPAPLAEVAPVAAPATADDLAAARPARSATVTGAALLARGIASLATGGAWVALPDAPVLALPPLPVPEVVAVAAPAPEAPAERLPPATETLAAAEPESEPAPVRVHAGLPSRDGAPGAAVRVHRGLP